MRYFHIDPVTKLAVAETDTHKHPNEIGIAGHWLPAEDGIATSEVYCAGEALMPLPPRPGPWAVFDPAACAWHDPRSPAEVEAELEVERRAATAVINESAGILRRVYVTDLPGQDALYLLKEAEARRWLVNEAPAIQEYPLIAAEIGITAFTADEVAQVYANLSAIYVQAAARLETVRLYHISLAEKAASSEAVKAAVRAFRSAISSTTSGTPA